MGSKYVDNTLAVCAKREMEQSLRRVPGMHRRRAVLELIHDVELLVRYARLNVAYQTQGLPDLYLTSLKALAQRSATFSEVR